MGRESLLKIISQMPYHTIALTYKKDEYDNLNNNRSWWTYFGRGLGLYLGMEAVNRVPALCGQNLYVRGGVVLLSAYLMGFGSRYVFQMQNTQTYNSIMNGLPVWDDPQEAVDLSRRFFHLDDDNNYQPSLFHHGLTKSFAPKEFCRIE